MFTDEELIHVEYAFYSEIARLDCIISESKGYEVGLRKRAKENIDEYYKLLEKVRKM